ncbi:MAG: purine-nucleoside phosphorylase [Acidobacteria bacterium]|nr:MAG: purine-nucleoside phosphorylase [Acidobacteriota bacterium]
MPAKKNESYYAQIFEAADHIRKNLAVRKINKAELSVLLGSGLGDFADTLQARRSIPFSSIPYFPSPSVAGHSGRLVFGETEGVPICCLQGRVHYYENHDVRAVTFPVRVLGALGIKRLIVTNAAGGLNSNWKAGDLMLIRDHVSFFMPNPLLGLNLDIFGPRFPDMSECYSKTLRQLALECARRMRLKLRQGVYAGVSGPSYETPAEVRMLKKMGADAVGMSTVPEVIVARHMGMECLGISIIANLAAGISGTPLSHREVLETAQRIQPKLTKFLSSLFHAVSRLSRRQ